MFSDRWKDLIILQWKTFFEDDLFRCLVHTWFRFLTFWISQKVQLNLNYPIFWTFFPNNMLYSFIKVSTEWFLYLKDCSIANLCIPFFALQSFYSVEAHPFLTCLASRTQIYAYLQIWFHSARSLSKISSLRSIFDLKLWLFLIAGSHFW